MTLIAEPAAQIAAADCAPQGAQPAQHMRLCIIGHPRYSGVAGHLPEYLSSIAQEACQRGWDVELFAAPKLCAYAGDTNREQAAHLHLHPHWPMARCAGNAEPRATEAWIKGWMAIIRAYGAVLTGRKCDHMLIVDGDQNYTAFALGLLALPLVRCGVSTIIFGSLDGIAKQGAHRELSLGAKVRLAVVRRFFGLKRFRGIITTNPAIASTAQQLPEALRNKVRYVQEIEPQWKQRIPMARARKHLGIEEHWRVVLCYGALGAIHKSLPQLFAAVDHGDMSDVLILLVGTPNASTEELLRSELGQRLKAAGNIREIFGFASAERERAAFSAADAVWIGRRPHKGPSGVLEIARAAGVPVIASSSDPIGWEVEREGLGWATDVEDAGQTRRALGECFHRPKSRENARETDAKTGEDGMCSRGFGQRICDVVFGFEKGQ